MVTVVIKKNENGSYSGFTCSGHADFDEAGFDIVCSAISILVLNTINSIATLTYNDMECDSDEVTGDIICEFPDGLDDKGTILIDSMIYGLKSVEGKYGSEYVKIFGNEK